MAANKIETTMTAVRETLVNTANPTSIAAAPSVQFSSFIPRNAAVTDKPNILKIITQNIVKPSEKLINVALL
jgi:hypothetical protein